MNKFLKFLKGMSNKWKIAINIVIPLLVTLYIWYFDLPPINIYSQQMWSSLSFIVVLSVVLYVLLFKKGVRVEKGKISFRALLVPIIIVLIIPAFMLVANIASSTFFNAKKYAGIIKVDNEKFEDDMLIADATTVTNIALMDTASAVIKGKTALGSLSDLVSQFTVGDYYTQINYANTPQKVSNLEYDGFFKWINNRETGIPGYIMVDPVNNTAKYVKLAQPMKYAESGLFSDDLLRKLRFSYPTKIFDSISFEIDENGDAFYIVSCAKPKVGLFGAMDINEVIIFNPVDGSSKLYDLKDVPSWVDIVFTGNLACEKYNWYGTLSGGFWNSVIGNRDCKRTTDDFGYVVIGDDVWYFTGVTSVTSDTSNIGFILNNGRTGQYKYYSVIGADEASAMGSAEGQVQEKGYTASFPTLINVSGQATYIMALKDVNGIVQLYALVNVENYAFAATGATQTEAFNAYKKLLVDNKIIGVQGDNENKPSVELVVEDVRIVDLNGDTVVYISDAEGKVYKGRLDIDEELIIVRKGDKLKIVYTDSEIERLFNISSWEFVKE